MHKKLPPEIQTKHHHNHVVLSVQEAQVPTITTTALSKLYQKTSLTASGKGMSLAVGRHILRRLQLSLSHPVVHSFFFFLFSSSLPPPSLLLPLFSFAGVFTFQVFCGFSSWKKTFVCAQPKEVSVQLEGAGTAVLRILLQNFPCLTLIFYSSCT